MNLLRQLQAASKQITLPLWGICTCSERTGCPAQGPVLEVPGTLAWNFTPRRMACAQLQTPQLFSALHGLPHLEEGTETPLFISRNEDISPPPHSRPGPHPDFLLSIDAIPFFQSSKLKASCLSSFLSLPTVHQRQSPTGSYLSRAQRLGRVLSQVVSLAFVLLPLQLPSQNKALGSPGLSPTCSPQDSCGLLPSLPHSVLTAPSLELLSTHTAS